MYQAHRTGSAGSGDRVNKAFILRSESDAQRLYAALKGNWRAFADRGHPLAVTVAEHKSRRSVEQNRRYWLILNQIAEGAWIGGKQFSAEAWHEAFKRRFIGCEETPDGGTVGISTTTLDVGSFGEYMTKIEAHAATELGVEIL
jgi:hypothetical protein